ncbi:MAG: SDR family NAD(P)-dependent oxidoreductase [Elusimicrobiota bacterium]|jgi:acyl transferase domain-containing protein/acyl carrier protein
MNRNETPEPIAIIGLGGIFPKSPDIPTYWRNILAKADCISEVTADRWDSRLYYSADHSAPDKTYSKIGGFVRDFKFDPLPLRIPPPVAKQMDTVQQFAVAATAEALRDSGYDKKPFDSERTAVIFGNAMGGPKKDETDQRVYAVGVRRRVLESKSLSHLDAPAREAVADEIEAAIKSGLSTINEDTMPGELSNVIAGRVANTFNLNGPNFTVDAACAASLAAVAQAVNGLRLRQFDMVVTGGIDQMMAPPSFVKFSKIGALSADGSRPFDAGANGFVMGEGAGVLVLKRVSDAVRDGDRIYALIRAIGAASDGRGKGITAPNPKGQRLAIERTFAQLDYLPEDVGLLEAHGTSTKVGDQVELQTASESFKGARPGSIGIGSVKSQIGHLKAAAGIAALIKAALAVHEKTLPPSINFKNPNPGVDWASCPFFVVTEPRPWSSAGKPRRANVSAFGFGGTNFHLALEEATPQTVSWTSAASAAAAEPGPRVDPSLLSTGTLPNALGGEAFFIGGASKAAVLESLRELRARVPAQGPLTRLAGEWNAARRSGEFVVSIAAESPEKLVEKIDLVLNAKADVWEKTPPVFRPKAIHPERRPAKRPKIGFMFPGQGLQYVDMLRDMAAKYQVVADTFAEADRIMAERTGPLTEILWTKEGETPAQVEAKTVRIKQTEITQPVVLTADIALLRLLRQYGVEADIVYGHSLGEYAAHVAAGVMEFKDALFAVSMRAKEMAHLHVDDNGKMASVSWPEEKIAPVIRDIPGYIIAANKNCPIQTVLSGDSAAIDEAIRRLTALGAQAQAIEVSHAFHSKIVYPAREPYAVFLDKVEIRAPRIPILSNLTAEFFPKDVSEIKRMMVEHMTSPVEFIRQTKRMYDEGVRVFVELGPKRALTAFVQTTLEDKPDAHVFASNHPKRGGVQEFNDLLARLESVGVELKIDGADPASPRSLYTPAYKAWAAGTPCSSLPASAAGAGAAGTNAAGTVRAESDQRTAAQDEKWGFYTGPVVVSGVAAGTPGQWERVFREDGIDSLLRGQNLISRLPESEAERQIDKNILRLIKSDDGNHRLERIQSAAEVVRLAGVAGEFDLAKEFGFKDALVHAMDSASRLAVAAGVLALRDAGLPLVRTYKKTSLGTLLPSGWALPEPLRAGTGVIFASAYTNLDAMASEVARYLADKYRGKPLRELSELFDALVEKVSDPSEKEALRRWQTESFQPYYEKHGSAAPYEFSRDFLLRVMPLAHSQLMQWIGARGPGMHLNAACASTTEAVGVAEDWLRLGRAERVLIIAGDDPSGTDLREWMLSGFVAAGAATTSAVVSEAALPFDRRRHGMIVGMGAAGMLLERGALAAERGMRPLVEILSTQYENSAFHATRLEPNHVADVMGRLVAKAEKRFGVDRRAIAAKALFMSHETYTPARGGSASAEVAALQRTFGADAAKIVVTNTKGFTGHSMGASPEDPTAIRALVTGVVPPIANYKEADPDLAGINLSRGGDYDLEYAIRLAAGFGSQIAMTLSRRVLRKGEARIADPARHKAWLKAMSGQDAPELEVVQNTLRVKENAAAARATNIPAPGPAVHPTPISLPQPVARQTPSPTPAAAIRPSTPAAGLSAAGAVREEDIRRTVLAIVSEKTGYPAEMLEPDLDMEADLGIDTVKQAELIGVIRERYGIPRKENLSLKDYPTLNHVVRFVLESTGGASHSAAPAPQSEAVSFKPELPSAGPSAEGTAREERGQRAAAPAPTAAPAPRIAAGNEAAVLSDVVAIVSEKTGYPAEMLEADLDMEADLGIDTVKQAELLGIIREKYGIPRKENLSLKDYPTLRHVARFVVDSAGLPSSGGIPAGSSRTVASAGTQPSAPAASIAAPSAVQTIPTPTATTAADGEQNVVKAVVALVSDKTGYPLEMLELNLDMEADLGIDTVKQAELFGLIREKYGIPRKENLSLKDYPTLSHVVRFVVESAGGSSSGETPAVAPQSAQQLPATPVTTAREEDVLRAVVTLVSEKTGYPLEMLELNLDMEADLGIDTVKQAELFGLIREKYGIPRKENLSLKDYPTLRHVVRFVQAGSSSSGEAPAASTQAAAAVEAPMTANPAPVEAPSAIAPAIAELDEDPYRDAKFAPWRVNAFPKPAKGSAPTLDKERAIVVLVLEPKTAEPYAAALEAAGGAPVVVKTADWADAAEATAELRKTLKDRKAGAILDLTALELPAGFDEMTPSAFDKTYRRTARALFLTAQNLRADLVEAGAKAWILVLTRMGGAHGVKSEKGFQPMAGAMTGLAKALCREFDKAAVRAVDFDEKAQPADMLALALGEVGSEDPRREIGYKDGVRQALRLFRVGRREPTTRRVTQRSVFLITGGGGALAAELAKDIARRWKPRIALVDLFPLPKEATVWARMSEDELKAMKAKMWEDMKADKSRRATPAMLEREFRRILNTIKLHHGIEELIRMGCRVSYHAADLTDPAETARAVKGAIKDFGQVDYVFHTAGLEESKLIADKKVENYDRVVRPKAHGAFNLMKALPHSPGQRWVFFSSIVARFGNLGQADYATANDFLVKLAAHMNATGRSAVAFDLTAFAEVGMATRGGVQQFLESMGVDFMPPKIGLGLLLDEFALGRETEVVLSGSLGKLDADGIMIQGPLPPEAFLTPALEAVAPKVQKAKVDEKPVHLFDRVLAEGPGHVRLTKTFSLEGDPWLHDHSISGVPYIPGVMGIELFAESVARMTGAPPKALAEVRFALPIKLLRGKPATVRVDAKREGRESALAIESDFFNAAGVKLGAPRSHFQARISTAGGDGWKGLKKPAIPTGKELVAGKETIYTLNFHGPSFQVLAGMYELGEKQLLALYRKPEKALWEKDGRTFVWNPLLIEAAFQTCGFRDLHFTKKLTLPDTVGLVQVFDHGAPPEELYVHAVYRGEEGDKRIYDAAVFDGQHRVWVRLADYRMIAQA